MSKNDEDYSDFISYLSNFLLVLSLFSGFTFAAITIIITQLPDPSQILIQITLFFLAVLLDVFLFLSFYFLVSILYCVGNIPPKTRTLGKGKAANLLLFSSFSLWGIAIELMFLFWNLTYLALASGAVYVVFVITTFIIIVKPGLEYLRREHSM